MAKNIGDMLKKISDKGSLTIDWKQGSFLGFGGDRSQTYEQCIYSANLGGKNTQFLVFIQRGYLKSDSLKINSYWQYGINEGIIFFVFLACIVFHDKIQTPYQNRFVTNKFQSILKAGNDALKLYISSIGVKWDAQWMIGDYLHTFP